MHRKKHDDEGASAVEYGLMVAAIAAVIVGLVFALGGVVRGAFDETKTQICKGATAAATTNAGCT